MLNFRFMYHAYWLKRDIINFSMTKYIPREITKIEVSLKLLSDHVPTIVYIWNKEKIPNWLKHRKYLSSQSSETVELIDLNDSLKLGTNHATVTPQLDKHNHIYFVDVERFLTEKEKNNERYTGIWKSIKISTQFQNRIIYYGELVEILEKKS